MDLVTIASASVAAGLLATTASRLALAGWRGVGAWLHDGQARMQYQSRMRNATEHMRLSSELKRQSGAGPNGGWRVMEVVETKLESDDCMSIYLQDPLHRSSTAQFKAGQFMLVRPALGGAALPSRCYSLSDCPGQPWWRITVKRQTPSSENQKSLSSWIFQNLHAGDCLLVNGPYGQFTLDPDSDQPLLLLAAGIGITPLLSILKTSLAVNPNRIVKLLYQVSDQQHWPFGETLHRWCGQFENLEVVTFFSRQNALPEVEGGQVVRGKFTAADVLQRLEPTTHCYLCGPAAWMSQCAGYLEHSGHAADHIHVESFTATQSEAASHEVAPWSVEFTRSQVLTPTSQQPTSLWQAAKANGIRLPSGCHTGACGTCKLKKLAGSVLYRKPPTCAHRDDEIVTCVAQPVGHVQVDA